MGNGFCGQILRVDLSNRRIEVERPGEDFYRKYLGGKGLAAYYLFTELRAGADPLGPENKLIFAASAVSGAPVPGFSRYTAAAKSPLTGGYGEAESGGFWATELKKAGFDAVIVQGRAETPVYLWIRDGVAELRDAGHLWGKSTSETEETLRGELGDSLIRVASVGPGGENLVRYACIMHEGRNAAGRGGLGAVMGSKRLKAIAVRGRGNVALSDPEAVRSVTRWFRDEFRKNPLTGSLHHLGTAGVLAGLNAGGILPTRNFSSGKFEEWEAISGEALEETAGRGKWGCYACPVRCKRTVAWPGEAGSAGAESRPEGEPDGRSGIPPGAEVAGPEYETIAAFGSNIGVSDLNAIIRANRLCNDAGLDTISTGVTIAFAMECFERGILTREDTGGLDLRFGNASTALEIISLIARREGIGELLAEGSRRVAERLGKGSEAFAVHVKGQEVPMHDPRGKVGVGIGMAVGEHGADHMTAAHDTMFLKRGAYAMEQAAALGILEPLSTYDLGPAKVRAYLSLELWWEALKALSICFFTIAPRGLMPIPMAVDAVRAITGWDVTLEEILKAGERASNLARAFNIREGFTKADDSLPRRMQESTGDQGHPGIGRGDLEKAVALYYEMKGWDPETGRPGRARLEELGLGWVSEALDSAPAGSAGSATDAFARDRRKLAI
ncbi:MAG: aldehyde ferredoxin oxidoreductase family protein [Actinobacteria bacterium]|nr:aldehyde ferredoxin oxidoreductase family protein [Actinomycetota bacterium]